MNILIIGASGYIGKELYSQCKENSYNVIGTCHSKQEKQDLYFYNVGESIDEIDSLWSYKLCNKVAIICAAQSNISQCKSNYDESYQINVTNMIKLIEQLKEKQYKIIFCSTDNVYDGVKGHYSETDDVNPVNEYGKMKAEIEKYLMQKYKDSCIVRISKVIGCVDSNKDMFAEWKKKAEKKECIQCIKNNYFSPIHISDVVNGILLIVQMNLNGIYNLCGNKRYLRIDLCKMFLKELSLFTDVIEKNLEDFQFNDSRPMDTSMTNQKFTEDTGYMFKEIEKCFIHYLEREI